MMMTRSLIPGPTTTSLLQGPATWSWAAPRHRNDHTYACSSSISTWAPSPPASRGGYLALPPAHLSSPPRETEKDAFRVSLPPITPSPPRRHALTSAGCPRPLRMQPTQLAPLGCLPLTSRDLTLLPSLLSLAPLHPFLEDRQSIIHPVVLHIVCSTSPSDPHINNLSSYPSTPHKLLHGSSSSGV
jgi:hypothetical protein